MTEEMRLYGSLKERDEVDVMADLYSIFMATENLEKAYIRDLVGADEYTPACSKLIGQYKTCITSLGPQFDVLGFIRKYEVSYGFSRPFSRYFRFTVQLLTIDL